LTPTIIAKEALRLLTNNLVMGNLVYRDYESEFPGAPKKGGSVQIRKAVKFKVAKTRIRSTKTITEQYITLNVATQAHISWNFFSVDLTLTIEQYSERYIRPAAAALANSVDSDLCALYDDIPVQIFESTGHVEPHSFTILGRAMQALDEEAVPPDDRVVVMNPGAHWSFANALSNWNFKEGGEQALRKGFLGRIANAEVFMDQNIKVHSVGRWATDSAAASSTARFGVHSTAVSAAGSGLPTGIAVGATQNQVINLDGFNQTLAQTVLEVGDTFTIAGCNAVNPMSGESTGSLRSFVVTASAVSLTMSTVEDEVAVSFAPEMIQTGPYATVDTIPQLEAAVVVRGSPTKAYPQNLAFHKNAFALCMVPLEVPDGVWSSTAEQDGYSCRIVKDYDIDADSEIIRLDILYGVKTIYPEMAARIMGAQQG
ncbi:MAG: hypothetical protein KAJ09_01540, partial [Deltaproteobacteria bacterium]|nr:hypothetical protein [Deltaproteobacteria bacterium]